MLEVTLERQKFIFLVYKDIGGHLGIKDAQQIRGWRVMQMWSVDKCFEFSLYKMTTLMYALFKVEACRNITNVMIY